MNQGRTFRFRAFRLTRWGPAYYESRGFVRHARVGDQVVELDLNHHRSEERTPERAADPRPSPFDGGVPVLWNGERVATVRWADPRYVGLVRRAGFDVIGDERFVLPGMRFTTRGLPYLLTLRHDGGRLVASRRWAAPLNMAVEELSFVRDYDLVPPRVARDTRPEHIALWLAMRECQTP